MRILVIVKQGGGINVLFEAGTVELDATVEFENRWADVRVRRALEARRAVVLENLILICVGRNEIF